MADIFCDFASGNDANDGSTRALAKKTLQAAMTAAGAGGRVGIKNNSAETNGSTTTLTSAGTSASPQRILSIDWSSDTFGSNAVSSGASFTLTGGSTNLVTDGFAYFYGIAFVSAPSGGGSSMTIGGANSSAMIFDTCSFSIRPGGSNPLNIGRSDVSIDGYVEFINTPVSFAVSDNRIVPSCMFVWRNTPSAIGGTAPTTLFVPVAGRREPDIFLSGLDLSAMGSGTNLFDLSVEIRMRARVHNCKLGSSVSVGTGSVPYQGASFVELVNSDSADTNYRLHLQSFRGTVTHESTIVRSGGASDGTTTISRKMVTTANANFFTPLSFDVVVWNESTSALTPAFEVVSDGVTFTDAELWAEAEYLGNSGFPYSAFQKDRATSILSTPANQTTSSVTWTTTGLSSPTKQKLELSFTPAEKGWIRFRVYLAKASSTVYVDPLPTGLGFTSGRQWQSPEAYVVEGASGGGGSGVKRASGMAGGMRG